MDLSRRVVVAATAAAGLIGRNEARRLSAKILVGGKLGGAATAETLAVENPADLSIIGEVPRCRVLDVERAVQAAHLAFPGWSAVPARERRRLLAHVADRLATERRQNARA